MITNKIALSNQTMEMTTIENNHTQYIYMTKKK